METTPPSCHLGIGHALACHSMHRLNLIRHSRPHATSLYVSQSAHRSPPPATQRTGHACHGGHRPRLSRRPQATPVTQNTRPRPHPAEAPPPRPLMPIYVIGRKPRPHVSLKQAAPPSHGNHVQATPPPDSFNAQATPRPVLGLRSLQPLTVPSPVRPRPLPAPALHHRPDPRCRSPSPAQSRYSRGEPQRRGGCLIGREVNGAPRGPGSLAAREALG